MIFKLVANIFSGIDESKVWNSSLLRISAPSKKAAAKKVVTWVEDHIMEHDPRISPRIELEFCDE